MKRSTAGLTIIELLVVMVILLLILGIILGFTTSSLSLFRADQARNGAEGNARSTFDVLGADIQQTGERLTSDFPALTITQDANGNAVLTLRRGLADGPLPLCAQTAGSIYVNGNVPVGYNTLFTGGISQLPSACTTTLQDVSTWSTAAGAVGFVIDMSNMRYDYLTLLSPAIITTGTIQTVNAVSSPSSVYDPRKVTVGAADKDIRVYLLENRVYSVSNGQLMLSQNTATAQPATPNVVSFKITPYLKPSTGVTKTTPAIATTLPFPPSPNPSNLNWKALAFLDVNLTVKDTSGSKTVTRTFNERLTPRNANSADR
ncbi:hypothetical protein GCM10022631_08440 [Deinococcus rubellus]|uniref:Prepilin-type N-terminal cleavage/methylation domain-containing protein n=1 Tax=Deinococcus rubellus TaxID=1889240 RepID=A0ABY5YGJ9_9DEIO|nr:hypothetical protein [Deinococcus rubellus]UWX64229.1 hypothetical protein N0D28_00690 [Deinococcus rubellus]